MALTSSSASRPAEGLGFCNPFPSADHDSGTVTDVEELGGITSINAFCTSFLRDTDPPRCCAITDAHTASV